MLLLASELVSSISFFKNFLYLLFPEFGFKFTTFLSLFSAVVIEVVVAIQQQQHSREVVVVGESKHTAGIKLVCVLCDEILCCIFVFVIVMY